MKLILAVLSSCVFATCGSAQEAPLCELFSYVTNETWFAQAVMGVIHQNYRPLECLGGCVLYSVNSTFGRLLKSKIGDPYMVFESCLKRGVKSHDTCEIADCVLELAINGIKMAKLVGVDIPYIDVIQQLLNKLLDQPHNFVLMDEQTLSPPYQVGVSSSNQTQQAPQKTQEPQPTGLKEEMHPVPRKPMETATQKLMQDHPVEVKTEKVNSASNMIPTFGLLHMCGLLLFLKKAY